MGTVISEKGCLSFFLSFFLSKGIHLPPRLSKGIFQNIWPALMGEEGESIFNSPTNVGVTRATPMARPLVAITDGC